MVLLAIPFGLAIGLAVGALGGGGSVLAVETAVLGALALVMLAVARATWRTAEQEPEPSGTWEGGGFLIIPTLAIALAFTMRTAVGTSLVIIAATSLLGLATHLLAGRALDPGVTAMMTLTCVAGSLAGVGLAGRLAQRSLGRGFAVLVLGVAAYLLVSIAVLGGPPAA